MEQPRMDSPVDTGTLSGHDGKAPTGESNICQDSLHPISFEIPLQQDENSDYRSSAEDTLLLAWLLVLYRYSDGGDVAFTWGYKHPQELHAVLSTAGLPMNLDGPVCALLDDVASYRRRIVSDKQGVTQSDRGAMFLTDSSSAPESPLDVCQLCNLQVEVQHVDWRISLQPSRRSPATEPYTVERHTYSLADIFTSIWTDGNAPVSKILEISDRDRAELWRWNAEVPPTITTCMHELIAERARATPTKAAIDAWDGQLSYQEVDQYSTRLARHLTALGMGSGTMAALCFEKSRWTVVGVLAVIKTGGAFVLMDPSQPVGRLQTIAEQVDARFMLTSQRRGEQGSAIAPAARLVTVSQETFQSQALLDAEPGPVSPTDLMYIICTSGSTGKPKAVMLDHQSYMSSAMPRSAAVGYDDISRVLDFASYAFDVSIDSMLCTLARGGCLCIPSDEDRLNDISGAMRRMKITMANITPSVARILDADIIPGLRSLGLGGEGVSASDVAVWGKTTRIVNGYGPSECGVGCTIQSSAATGKSYVNIGTGTGGVMWIADRDDHNRLVPVGAIGELLVEGPCVGQGYLGEPEKTAEVFIEDPEWLLAGFGDVPGRRGRLYKTGDLVKYDPDGSGCLVFVGRKDTQVKLRGQRVELGEVEHHLRAHLPARVRVAAEVVKPAGQNKQPALVAFIAEPADEAAGPEVQRAAFSPELAAVMADMDEKLSASLPVYMVPSAYISISQMPLLVSGKTDRKKLRELGSSMMLADVAKAEQSGAAIEEPSTPAEHALRRSWSRVLRLPEDQIGMHQNFFALGGDSVLAMKLVAAARDDGLSLSVSDVFSGPKLSAMARAAKQAAADADMDVPAFSLLEPGWAVDAARAEAAALCGVALDAIEDIYPCTPLQEQLMAFTARSTKSFVARRIAEVADAAQAERLVAAWEAAAADSHILRTRVVQFEEHGLMQVVVSEKAAWGSGRDVDEYIAEEERSPMGLGTPLSRYAIVTDDSQGKRYFVWTVHHALYDGWSTPLVLERVTRAYQGLPTSRPAEMKHFIRHLRSVSRDAAEDFWRTQLQGATGPQFPALPSRTYLPQPDALVERFVTLKRSPDSSIMVGTLIRAAWALVAAMYTASDDVVFGETFTGRSVPIAGAEQIEAPMITTVPVRVRIDRSAPLQEYLQAVQEQGFARMPYEHMGMQNIRRVSADAQLACEVKVGLVIQPSQAAAADAGADAPPRFDDADAAREALHFNSYPLMLVFSLQDDGFLALAHFDSALVAVPQMERALAHFDCAVQQLAAEGPVAVGQVDCLTEQERADIWQWNKMPPASLDAASHRLAVSPAKPLPAGDAYPAITVPWIVDPADHGRLMPVGTVGELVFEGPLASADYVQDPSWLALGGGVVPGRRGQVHKTGDLVRYDPDGAVLFVRRKEPVAELHGRAVDLYELERHLQKLLPPSAEVAAQIIFPASQPAAQDPVLVAFVAARADAKASLELNFGDGPVPSSVSPTVSTQLAHALIGLSKALSEVVPPHMIPSAYIPLRQMPTASGEVDREQLLQLGAQMSHQDMLRLRAALAHLRAAGIDDQPWTEKECKLQQLWARFLGIDAADIARDDSFFRLGGDSILAMRLVSAVRQAGYTLSVADVFRRMRLSDMANSLGDAPSAQEHALPLQFQPFSALDVADVDTFLSVDIRPALADPSWMIKDVLPLTDPQARDVEATVYVPRSAVQYDMLYLQKSVDRGRLLDVCQQLVSRHEILRTVFVQQSGRYLQVILEQMDAPIATYEADEDDLDSFLAKLCAEDIEADQPLGSPFVKFMFVHGTRDENCLAVRLSHAQYDGVSLPELIRQIEVLYAGGEVAETPQFSSYMHHIARQGKQEAFNYWRQLLNGSALTVLEPTLIEEKTAKPAFITKPVDVAARIPDVTMATMLTAAWAVVLARRLSIRDVTFGSVATGRGVDVPEADKVMGPCYQYVPVRVHFKPEWTVSELLHHVQDQHVNNLPFESLGFRELADACTSWPSGVDFFDSLVHHQDIEYFDTIPFAGTSCRVEIANPHPEPSHPLKIVSYPQDGLMYYGIAISELRQHLAASLLDELCCTITQFIQNPDSPIPGLR